jgi:mono/diheme cytochrome c family protein
LISISTLAASTPLFETLRWTAPEARLEAVSSQPSACLAYSAGSKSSVQMGQALFNTPTLLGGQAAKAGVSCASCHVNGRDNPHFMLAGVSDKPGTADVTNSFFAAARSNGKFDPVPIPDLAMPGKVSHERGSQALERFIRNLVVEEFSGAEPSETMLKALAAYVRAIEPCKQNDKEPMQRHVDDQLIMIDAAYNVAILLAVRDDREQELRLLIAGMRHKLGLIAERYAGKDFTQERQSLLSSSRKLQAIAQQSVSTRALSAWKKDFDKRLSMQLRRKQEKSLYDPKLLAAAL